MTQPAPFRILLVTIGGQRYALPLDAVREVCDAQTIARVPLMPAALAGVIDVRGRIVPVIDPATLLGTTAAPIGRQIVVVAAPDNAGDVGLQVDDVPGLGLSTRAVSPRTGLPRFVDRLVDTSDGTVQLLDLAGLLDALPRAS